MRSVASSAVFCTPLGIALALLLGSAATAAETPPVSAGTPSGQQLYAPADSESFDFMVFGDRTGGPPEGIAVLADAVKMANWLDADFVLTVGDLVQGYNEPEKWLTQTREFKATMDGLRMPWYPVPGNHDVYARPARPGGNTDLYKEHFGPLYYSFGYKWAHFIVLFSDEGFSFRNPAEDQNLSPEQLAWLRQDLAGSAGEQVFVFLHHPRWTPQYEGCNWPEAHELFVADGRPTTVYAGHIHMYRDDGQVDNVHYYALATTGGHMTRYRASASLHHVNFVRVRPDRVTTAVLPVGSIFAGDFVLGEEVDEMNALTHGEWLTIDGRATIGAKAGERSSFTVTLSNPTERTVHFQLDLTASQGWKLEHERIDRTLDAGGKLTVPVRAAAPALGSDEPRVNVQATLLYQLRSGLLQPIEVQTAVPVGVKDIDKFAQATPEANGVLALDGASAVRVTVPEQLEQFTLECWVRGQEPAGRAALVTKTESSAYGIFWSDAADDVKLPTGYVGTTAGYLMVPAAAPWKWDQWTHVALVFDGRQAAFYVNGQLQSVQTTDARPTHNRWPLFIGADPNQQGEPVSFFTGAIDEVRLSDVSRYDGPFAPRRVFARDAHTLLLLHFDQMLGGVLADDSGTGHHGWAVGGVKIDREDR